MHIPDGFLDAKTMLVTGALSAAGLSVALRHAQKSLPRRRVPLLGLAAAFVFAAQMLNFPVIGGTSGHLVGGVLAAVLLGPSAAVVVLTAVLLVQCFMFADGGVWVLGANVFNMAILGTVGGYGVYRLVCKWMLRPVPVAQAAGSNDQGGVPILEYETPLRSDPDPAELRTRLVAAAFAAWCSTVLAAVACAGELALSGRAAWSVVFPTMAGVHMLIGIGEAVITALVLVAVGKSRPELLAQGRVETAPAYGPLVAYGLLSALGLALFVSPLASKWPDGLDKTAEVLGFASAAAEKPLVPAPMPEYEMPGVPWATAATSLAGAVGTVVMFILALLIGRILMRPTAGTNSDS